MQSQTLLRVELPAMTAKRLAESALALDLSETEVVVEAIELYWEIATGLAAHGRLRNENKYQEE